MVKANADALDADKYCDMGTIADWKMDLMLFEVLKALNLGDSTSVHAAYQTFKNKNTKETNEARALRDAEAKLRKIQIKLENLTEMRVNGEVGKQEFMSLKTKINGEMLVVEKEIDDIKRGVLDEERKTTPLISFEVFKSIAIEKLDFSKPIKQSNLVDVIVKKIVPNTAQDFKWYLNLFPREEGTEENDYKEIVVLEIDYGKAKKFREMRGGMLRKNQWKDLIIRIMA